MSHAVELLDDETMRGFVVSGFMTVKTQLPAAYHEEIVSRIDSAIAGKRHPYSRILDDVPELHAVFKDPYVDGALRSLLGADCRMHYYTISHCNPPGYPGQLWHQGSTKDRPRQIWRLQVFYFPRAVTYEMGPTIIAPGTQYRTATNTNLYRYGFFKNQVSVTVEAGSVLLMHYDIWHRGSVNQSKQTRYMIKTVFERSSDPSVPSWNAGSDSNSPQTLQQFRKMRIEIDNETETYRQQELWIRIWKWLHGEQFEHDDWFPAYLP